MTSIFKDAERFLPPEGSYGLLSFRFSRLIDDRYVLVNESGEWLVLKRADLESFIRKDLKISSPLYSTLKVKHFLRDSESEVWRDLLTLKVRTKRSAVSEFTRLHMFVVTLRCNHSCKYCQVTRQSETSSASDMSLEVADKAVEFAFRSPTPSLKFEFQGGEPLLNSKIIKRIVLEAKRCNESQKRNLAFVIATNLSLLDDEILGFCRDHQIEISTSLDGPEDLHNAYRLYAQNNSYQATISGIEKIRKFLGEDKVSALMTTTFDSLPRVKEIIDEYIKQGLSGIFLRSLNPFGYAVRSKYFGSYTPEEWLDYYERGLNYILDLNREGIFFVEYFAALILQKMLTPYGVGYVNLQSPSGMGIAGIVYNYNGEVYPSDEARMKAEMGDKVFCMGNLLRDTYEQIMLSPALISPLEESVAESSPMCEECAFLSYCGSDPDYHYATEHDFVGHKALSGFCRKNMGIFRLIIRKMEDDPAARQIMENWVQW